MNTLLPKLLLLSLLLVLCSNTLASDTTVVQENEAHNETGIRVDQKGIGVSNEIIKNTTIELGIKTEHISLDKCDPEYSFKELQEKHAAYTRMRNSAFILIALAVASFAYGYHLDNPNYSEPYTLEQTSSIVTREFYSGYFYVYTGFTIPVSAVLGIIGIKKNIEYKKRIEYCREVSRNE